MVVYKIARTKYAADFTGEGARLFGGRWNHKNIPCIYTASSRALAVLEYTVNVNIDDIPRALSIASIEIPDDNITYLSLKDLPGNWRQSPAPSSTKDFGSILLKQATKLVIRLPSTIVPEEWNYIINPTHADINTVQLLAVNDYPYDVRIKLK